QGLEGTKAPAECRIGILHRIPIYFEDAIHQIQYPVVCEAGAGVNAALVVTVEAQARLADLDHENRPRRVLSRVIPEAPGHHRDIRFWLGLIVECHRALPPPLPPRAECRPQPLFHRLDRSEVVGALRLRYDELAADQLDRVARLKESDRDQSIVLGPAPGMSLDLALRHAPSLATPAGVCQCPRQDTHPAPGPPPPLPASCRLATRPDRILRLEAT